MGGPNITPGVNIFGKAFFRAVVAEVSPSQYFEWPQPRQGFRPPAENAQPAPAPRAGAPPRSPLPALQAGRISAPLCRPACTRPCPEEKSDGQPVRGLRLRRPDLLRLTPTLGRSGGVRGRQPAAARRLGARRPGDLGGGTPPGRATAPAGLEDPRVLVRGGRRGGTGTGLRLLSARAHHVQVPARAAHPADAELQVLPTWFERKVLHALPGGRRRAAAVSGGPRTTAGRTPRPVHPQRSALGGGTAVSALRGIRRAPLSQRRRSTGAGTRRPGRPAGPRCPRRRFLGPRLGTRTRIRRRRHRRAQRPAGALAPLHRRTRPALLQRGRRLPGPQGRGQSAGGAQGGSPPRGPRPARGRRRHPAPAGTRHDGPPGGIARGPRTARTADRVGTPFPGPGIRRGTVTERVADREVPAHPSGRRRHDGRRVHPRGDRDRGPDRAHPEDHACPRGGLRRPPPPQPDHPAERRHLFHRLRTRQPCRRLRASGAGRRGLHRAEGIHRTGDRPVRTGRDPPVVVPAARPTAHPGRGQEHRTRRRHRAPVPRAPRVHRRDPPHAGPLPLGRPHPEARTGSAQGRDTSPAQRAAGRLASHPRLARG